MEWKNTFQLNKQGKSLELPLKPFVTGIVQAGLVLLDLHPEYASTVSRISKTFLVAIVMLLRKKKLLTVEYLPKSKWMTLNDKRIFLNTTTLIISWLQTSVLGLTGKEKDFKPFWNEQCQEISQKLWFPTETDYVGSPLNSSSGCWNETMLNSLSSIKKKDNLKMLNSPMISSPSYMFFPVGKWEEEGIKSRKIRIYPNQDQRKMFSGWIGTSRYVYNRSLEATKKGENMNFYALRNKYVISKNNPNVEDWEKETPKDIRAGAIRDMVKSFRIAITNLKRGNIRHFKLGFRSRKKVSSIEIPKSSIKIKDKQLFIYNTYMKDSIKLSKDKSFSRLKIEYDCRLKNERGKWYLYVPIKNTIDTQVPPLESCSLDPGVRKFQTIYSEEMAMKIEVKKELLTKLQTRLDNFQSLRSRKLIRKTHYVRRTNMLYSRLDNLIDDLHYKTISLLTSTFKTIFLPSFESQELVKRNRSRKCRRGLLSLKHYLFKQRLLDRCKVMKNCNTYICTEEYTSKTCGGCGTISSIGSKEMYDCSKCNMVLDRDINGARNILIKMLKETS